MQQLHTVLLAAGLLLAAAVPGQAQFGSGGVPTSDQCAIDICVPPDVTIECISEDEEECHWFMIGESANLCREFHATGGGKMNLTVAWNVLSDNAGIAGVSNARVSYGKTTSFETAGNVTTNPYSTQFGNGQTWQTRDHYLRICADVEAINAGETSILYEATITDYSF